MDDVILDESGNERLQFWQQAADIRNNLVDALPTNPDKEAEIQRIAKFIQAPVESVRSLPDEARTQASLQKFDAVSVARDLPALTKFLTDPDRVKIAHDDIPSLAKIEQMAKPVAKAGDSSFERSITKGLVGFSRWLSDDVPQTPIELVKGLGGSFNTLAQSVNTVAGALPVMYDAAAGGTQAQDWWFKHMVDRTIEQSGAFKPGESFSAKAANSVGSLIGMLSQITLTGGGGAPVAGVPAEVSAGKILSDATAHAMKSMAFPAMSDAVNTGRRVYMETGGDSLAASKAATAQWASTTGMGLVPLSAPGGLVRRVGTGAISGLVQGEASRVGMNAVLPDSMQSPFDWEQTVLSGMTGAAMGGIMGPRADPTFYREVRKTYDDAAKAEKSAADFESLNALSQISAVSKLRERDGEAFRQFVNDATADGHLENVYIDASKLGEVLHQSGIDDAKLSETLPDVARQLAEARQTEGMVRIPIADYAAKVAGGPLDASLLPELRTTPDGMTQREGQAFYQTQVDTLKAAAEKIIADRSVTDAQQAQSDALKVKILDSISAGSKFKPDVNDTYATLQTAYTLQRAAMIGMDPMEFHDRYGARVVSDLMGGGKLDQGERGAYSPATNTIALLKGADLTTFLHESGHYFLNTDAQLAALPDAPEALRHDMSTVLDWLGVKGTPESSAIDEWHRMSLDEQRQYHEKYARGFESYLFEGKAPNLEMQGVFARLRSWMISVYKKISALDVELSPDVRGVFDRMLASEESIKSAEQSRQMLPIFTERPPSMTPEQFAKYQQLGAESTVSAIEELQGKSLRDMKWLSNAKSKALKELQAQAKEERQKIQIEARREVLDTDTYRAWQFLTRRVEDADKIGKERKANPDYIDESQDTMMQAIAKLGGLNRDEVVSTWGTDPSDKPSAGLFGKPVWRSKGGKSIDHMAELLAERGYLSRDENGRHDLAEFEEKFDNSVRGGDEYSMSFDYGGMVERKAGDALNVEAMEAGRLDRASLVAMFGKSEFAVWRHLEKLGMVKANGIHPDVIAERFGFQNGEDLTRTLAAAEKPKQAIDALTDKKMLEQHGELTDPQAMERAAEAAIHNEARSRFVATELAGLTKAVGSEMLIAKAAQAAAQTAIAQKVVRDIRPGQYTVAEARAAKAADLALRSGDEMGAVTNKRAQLLNNALFRASNDALESVRKGVDYLNKFGRKGIRGKIDPDYLDQIDALLDRHDIRRSVSGKALDKRQRLLDWVASQEEKGISPNIPEKLLNDANRTHYKSMTVEEFSGLVDTVKQIEHLGRLKNRMLLDRANRDYQSVRDEIVSGIMANSEGRSVDARTPVTTGGRIEQGVKGFFASHLKAPNIARILDGGKDGGPVWEHFIRTANDRADFETVARHEATEKLFAILNPVLKLGRMEGKGQLFDSIGVALNRAQRIVIALNVGNEGNLQRLLGGERWTRGQIDPVLRSLTEAEWRAVQGVWDLFESYRPLIAEKERRVYGVEPKWIEPTPFTVVSKDGKVVSMRGGYYPIKYDPIASERAERFADAETAKDQMRGAYTSATTRRSFTKERVKEVHDRPLMYSLTGLYSGLNEVIHDLAWHEWLIDTNKLMRSQSIDHAIRSTYGPEYKRQLKTWVDDVAKGDAAPLHAMERAVAVIRHGVTVAGLGFNVMNAAIQPLGFTQSIVRIGPKYAAVGLGKLLSNPLSLSKNINEMSDFMRERGRTRFRELNELRNQVQGKTAIKQTIEQHAYSMMLIMQRAVDLPTWWGGYSKALAEGNADSRAIALADQAVKDSQGSGLGMDLSAIERGGPFVKLFTTFYSFMNTAFNLGVERTMSANTPAKKGRLAADYLLLYVLPPALGLALKNSLTPGDSGLDDEEKLMKRLAKEQIGYGLGLMVGVREFQNVSDIVTGKPNDYAGPAGLRLFGDTIKFAQQAHQGEFDDAFRKSLINLAGDLFALPSAQVNRSITGVNALREGKTENPAAAIFGFQEPH